MTKFAEDKYILDINKELKNLIYYNIVFYYHDEPIELLTYYLNNLKFLFGNINYDNNYDSAQFCFNFFVSDLNKFIELLKVNKFIILTDYKAILVT
jgi:hypothetical protein